MSRANLSASCLEPVGIVPAQWQTDVRNAQTDTWPDYMSGVRRSTGLRGRLGWLANCPDDLSWN